MTSDSGKSAHSMGLKSQGLWRAVAALAVVVTGMPRALAQSACQYEVTVVTGPPCPPFESRSVQFLGINDLGQACGREAKCGGGWLPLVWTPEQGRILLPLPEGATEGQANDINNVLGNDGIGQVACTLEGPGLLGRKPYLYHDGEWIPLGLLPGSNVGEAFAINDLSEIIGESANIQIGPTLAFFWRNGSLEELSLPLGPNHSARGISESSFVTGWMGDSFATTSHAYRWHLEEVLDLGTYPAGTTGDGWDVNSFGIVTGRGNVQFERGGPTVVRSFIANSQMVEDIGVLPGRTFTRAAAISEVNQIVGFCHNPFGLNNRTFIWTNGNIHALNDFVSFPPGIISISEVTAINVHGQIAGSAVTATSGTRRGAILTPIKRPIGDVNIDCRVDAHDLAILLDNWGTCPDLGACVADFVSTATFHPPPDGVVDAADLANLLGHWTGTLLNSSRRN